MNKSKKIILAVIFVAVLLMAVGYAALANVELTIGGSASAVADDANFKVWFTGATPVTNGEGVTASAEAEKTTATVTIPGLKVVGEEKFAILEITNASADIDATSVKVTTEGKSDDYIKIAAIMCNAEGTPVENAENPLAVGGKTYVKVSAELIKTITSPKETTINVVVTAVPEELN